MQESGLLEIIPLICTLASRAGVQSLKLVVAAVAEDGSRQPVCLHPEFPQG